MLAVAVERGGNGFRGITVNTSVAGVLTGPDANFKHMSQEVQNKEEGTLANPNAARLRLRSSSRTQTPSVASVQAKWL